MLIPCCVLYGKYSKPWRGQWCPNVARRLYRFFFNNFDAHESRTIIQTSRNRYYFIKYYVIYID